MINLSHYFKIVLLKVVYGWVVVINFLLFKDSSSYEDMLDNTMDHYRAFFEVYSTLMNKFEEVKEEVANFFSNTLVNSTILANLNETLQDNIKAMKRD